MVSIDSLLEDSANMIIDCNKDRKNNFQRSFERCSSALCLSGTFISQIGNGMSLLSYNSFFQDNLYMRDYGGFNLLLGVGCIDVGFISLLGLEGYRYIKNNFLLSKGF